MGDGFEFADLPVAEDDPLFPDVYVGLEIDLLAPGDGVVTDRHHASSDRYEPEDPMNQIEEQISPFTLSGWLRHGCEEVLQIADAAACHPGESDGNYRRENVYERDLDSGYHEKGSCTEEHDAGSVVYDSFGGFGDQLGKLLRRPVSFSPIWTHVDVSTHTSEEELLAAVTGFVNERLSDSEVLLVAYNGERWNGGFDLPFLRTRYAEHDRPLPFVDVPYADVLPLVTDRFNTCIDGDDQQDLESVYGLLCNNEYADVDPFDESSDAVPAFENGWFEELVQHNVADVLRTRSVGWVAERYCSKSESKVKSLTPTRSVN